MVFSKHIMALKNFLLVYKKPVTVITGYSVCIRYFIKISQAIFTKYTTEFVLYTDRNFVYKTMYILINYYVYS